MGSIVVILMVLLFLLTGNAAVVKPSEVCVHTSKLMEDLLPIYIDKVTYRKWSDRLCNALTHDITTPLSQHPYGPDSSRLTGVCVYSCVRCVCVCVL